MGSGPLGARGPGHSVLLHPGPRRRGRGQALDQALAVEDSLHGLRAAKAAGLWCVAVPGPLTRGLDFSDADLVLDSLADLSLRALLSELGSCGSPDEGGSRDERGRHPHASRPAGGAGRGHYQ